MKGDPEERALAVGEYLVNSGATVRAAARVFGVSKSTVWKDQARLRRLNPGLWSDVRKVLQKNKAERHLRGGEATRCKYLRCSGRGHPPDQAHVSSPGAKVCAGKAARACTAAARTV